MVCPISFHGMQWETLLLLLNSFRYFVCLVLCLTFMWEEQLDIVCVCHPGVWVMKCMLYAIQTFLFRSTELNKILSDIRPCASQLNCYKEL